VVIAIGIVLTARMLGPEQFGVLGTFFAIASVASLVLRFLLVGASRFAAGALEADEREVVLAAAGRVLALVTAITAGLLIGAIAFSEAINELLRVDVFAGPALIALLVPAMGYELVISGLLLGQGRIGTVGAVWAIESIARIALTVVLVATNGITGALVAYVASVYVASTVATMRIGGLRWRLPSSSHLAGTATTSLASALVIAIACVPQYLDLVLVRTYLDPVQAGWYATAGTVSGFLFVIGMPICLAIHPRVVTANLRGQSAAPVLLSHLGALIVVGGSAVIGARLLGAPVLGAVFGEAFAGAADVLPFILARTSGTLALLLAGTYAIACAKNRVVLLGSAPALFAIMGLPVLQPEIQHAGALSAAGAILAATLVTVATLDRGGLPTR
jgi:O-antigen/teichoic acid export membrane protein